MRVHFLDPYIERNSLVHRLDARIKLVLVIAFILTTALTPQGAWPVYILLLSIVLAAELISELGVQFFFKRALLAAPFVLAALPVLLTVPGPVLVHLPFGLAISTAGLERFFSIAFKSWISVQMAILLASTTPFPSLLVAMRALRLPRLLVAIISLMWRYLFVMVDEALRMLRAREARSSLSELPGLKHGGTLAWRAKVTGGMAGSLFLRSLERSDRIYNAMLARGYDGEVRSLPQPAIRREEWLALMIGLLLYASLLALSYGLN